MSVAVPISLPAVMFSEVALSNVLAVCEMLLVAVRSIVVAVRLPAFKLFPADMVIVVVAVSLATFRSVAAVKFIEPAVSPEASSVPEALNVIAPPADELLKLTVPVLVSTTDALPPAVRVTLLALVSVIPMSVPAVISKVGVLTNPDVWVIAPLVAVRSTDVEPLRVPLTDKLVAAVKSTLVALMLPVVNPAPDVTSKLPPAEPVTKPLRLD